jgi:PAS domain S-box-containing protein
VHRQTVHKWTDNELEIVKLVVNRCWESLERTRAARKILESDERFRLALSSGAVTVYEQDTKLRYLWIYPQIYGDATIGRTDLELSPGRSGEELTALKKQVMETREPLRKEIWANVGGETIWFDLLVEPRFVGDGELSGVGGTALNITEKKKLEADLLESEARFRGLMEQAPLSIQLYDSMGRHIRVNRAWEELWGLKFEDIPEYNVLEDPQLEEKGVAAVLRRVFAGEAAELPLIEYDPEETIPGKSANRQPSRWVSAIAYPLKGPDGTVQEVALVHQDVTKQKSAERELTFQKTVLESVTETVLDGILIVSTDGTMIHCNQRFLEIWDFPQEVMASRSDAAAHEWAAQQTIDPQGFLGRVTEAYDLRTQTREEIEMRDGRTFERFGAPVYSGDARLGWVWTFRDVTDRKMVEHALENRVAARTQELAKANEMLLVEMEERARSEKERLDLLKQIYTIQEAERGRIARDIHDQLGQRVTALRFKTALIKTAVASDEKLAMQADELQDIARQLDHEVSFVAWELRPSILDDLTFAEALKNFVTEWSLHSGIAAEFHMTGALEIGIGRDVETNLYRIVQEALNNAAKHSRATGVNVLLESRLDLVTLIVEDNGVGISGKPSGNVEGLKGLGLRGMRERASLVGGTVEIESSSVGTSLFIRIPLSSSDIERKPVLV